MITYEQKQFMINVLQNEYKMNPMIPDYVTFMLQNAERQFSTKTKIIDYIINQLHEKLTIEKIEMIKMELIK